MKTSGGKYIAPQPIENKLKMHPAVANAIVIGDKRKFPSVLLVPNFDVVRKTAGVDGPPETIVRDPRVRSLFQKIVDDLNAGLAQYEKLKKFELIPSEFTVGSGELTPTMKVKRRIVEQRYKSEIDALYAE
jgi:long-chain acyl-CoA synthetase